MDDGCGDPCGGPRDGDPLRWLVESAEPSLECETVGAGDCRWAGGVKNEGGRFLILKGFCSGTVPLGLSTTSNKA